MFSAVGNILFLVVKWRGPNQIEVDSSDEDDDDISKSGESKSGDDVKKGLPECPGLFVFSYVSGLKYETSFFVKLILYSKFHIDM